MTRPLTCLTLIVAAGAGLYLYQEKHRAAMLDREINRVIHATEQTRERTGMLKAEHALLSGPDRLAGLAAAHLSLAPVTPQQFVPIADLAARLPPVGGATEVPAELEPPAPVALAAPALATKPETPRPEVIKLAAPAVHAAPATAPGKPGPALLAQAATPTHAAGRDRPAAVKLAEARPASPVFAPVVPAFASQAPAQAIHAPTIQQASAVQPPSSFASPFVGSALGMARTALAAPVPMGQGAAAGR